MSRTDGSSVVQWILGSPLRSIPWTPALCQHEARALSSEPGTDSELSHTEQIPAIIPKLYGVTRLMCLLTLLTLSLGVLFS